MMNAKQIALLNTILGAAQLKGDKSLAAQVRHTIANAAKSRENAARTRNVAALAA